MRHSSNIPSPAPQDVNHINYNTKNNPFMHYSIEQLNELLDEYDRTHGPNSYSVNPPPTYISNNLCHNTHNTSTNNCNAFSDLNPLFMKPNSNQCNVSKPSPHLPLPPSLSNMPIYNPQLSLFNHSSATSTDSVAMDSANANPSNIDTPIKKSNRGRKKIDRSEFKNAEGRYQCKICSKSYKRYNDLKGHHAIHSEKTECCPFCNRKFSRPVYLRDHIRSHTGEKPFDCDICHKRFAAKRNLVQHRKRHLRNGARNVKL